MILRKSSEDGHLTPPRLSKQLPQLEETLASQGVFVFRPNRGKRRTIWLRSNTSVTSVDSDDSDTAGGDGSMDGDGISDAASVAPFQIQNDTADGINASVDDMSSTAIRALIEDVVDIEGPISLRLMARRVAAHWGLHRISSKALDRVSVMLPRSNVQVDSLAGGTFLWPIGVDPDSYQGFRVPDSNADTIRDSLDMPLQEVANAVVFLLESQISAPEVEVVREASRLFGFRKTGKLVDDRMRAGIEYSVQKGTVKREGDSLTL